MSMLVVVKAPTRQLDWKGHRVRAAPEIVTGALVIPVGAVGTVTWASNGQIQVTFDACSCCGVAARLQWKRVDDPELLQFVAPATSDLLAGTPA
jgi:hypothetical protein